ncbi:MAG: hypothetical protein MUF49_02570 [Oculatellaceae cyanobacterium Prado106]|jgi:hypothetical protein|nr:hypothetical protein [Oculatellaceae cyanobacterium Prado106]
MQCGFADGSMGQFRDWRTSWIAGQIPHWAIYWKRLGLLFIVLLTHTGCSVSPSAEPPRSIQVQQTWQLQPGDKIGTHLVVAGLGDISIDLSGESAYAPFDGRVQPIQPAMQNCVVFSSPEIPAYLFRLCGLQNLRLGAVYQGNVIGQGAYLHFATLRRQTDGTWAMVEPARDILERILRSP